MDDKYIIELYEKRSETAISLTDKKYGKYLYKIAYNILRIKEDSEESVNDTYLGAWNTIPPQKPDRLKLYLGKITRNTSLKRLRKNTAQKRGGGQYELALSELDEVLSSGGEPEKELELKLIAERLNIFLGELSDRQRAVFIARYWYLFPVKKIASKLGLGESDVKMTLKRLRGKLADELEKEGLV